MQQEGRIILKTAEGQEFVVMAEIAQLSKTISNMLEDGLTKSQDGADTQIPLPNIEADTMACIIQLWQLQLKSVHDTSLKDANAEATEATEGTDGANKDKTDAPDPDAPIKEVLKDMEKDDLFAMLNACNYLDTNHLTTLGAKEVARRINGKSVQELRDYFGIENDFTPEEEERIRQENAWCQLEEDEPSKDKKDENDGAEPMDTDNN